MTIIHQETTTLSEGATVSLIKYSTVRKTGGLMIHTELRARRDENEIKMSVDDVSPTSMKIYLAMVIRAIETERKKLTVKPEYDSRLPDTFRQFVNSMAFNDMFIFNALEPSPSEEQDVKPRRNKKVPRTRKAIPKQHGIKNNQSSVGRTTDVPPADEQGTVGIG
jgi:hypothetical protein